MTSGLSRFGGKIAIVTGSTYGIGYAVAQRLAREGAKVLINSRNQENVEEAAKKLTDEGLDVKGVVCHVSDPSARKKLLDQAQKWGGLDILVMNAAVNPSVAPIYDCPESAWDKIIEVNLKSAFMMSKEALPLLRKSKAGRIIYTSTVGVYTNGDNIGAYTVSKVALIGLMKMGAAQLGKEKITVNCVSPGLIKTKFSEILWSDKETHDMFISGIPLGRLGVPDEVANAAVFLASDEASYITGENICVGGGLATRL